MSKSRSQSESSQTHPTKADARLGRSIEILQNYLETAKSWDLFVTVPVSDLRRVLETRPLVVEPPGSCDVCHAPLEDSDGASWPHCPDCGWEPE